MVRDINPVVRGVVRGVNPVVRSVNSHSLWYFQQCRTIAVQSLWDEYTTFKGINRFKELNFSYVYVS